jgi:transposase InsO family protein
VYYERKAQQRNPNRRSYRAQWDEYLSIEIVRVWEDNFRVYGVRKVWRQLTRDGIPAARCTVERLMRRLGISGAIRGRSIMTTRSAQITESPNDLVQRHFVAERPNQLWIADFTYVATWSGFAFTAFVVDVFSRRIVGWRVASTMSTDLPLDALEQALHDRKIEEPLIHHSDRGSQYLSLRYSDRLADAGIEPSVGSTGDSYDNAMAESIIGLYKTEVIRRHGPWRSLDAVEIATLDWVDWYNTKRLMEPLGYRSPVEVETEYYQARESRGSPELLRQNSLR